MKKYFNQLLFTFSLFLLTVHLLAQPAGIAVKGPKTPAFDFSKSGPVLFDQMQSPGTAMMSSFHYTNADMENMTCAAAEDFHIPENETWDVYAFGVIGSYFKNMPGGGDTLNVFILADNDGKPGDTLYQYWAYTGFEKQEIPVVNESGDTYVHTYFEINLPSVVSLSSGDYWLSVQMYADANVTGKWGWKEEIYTTAINGAEWHWINPLNGTGYGYTEWTPASVVVGPWLTWELSFAVFGVPKANDLAVKEIVSPQKYYYGIPEDPKPVTVVIRNEGTTPQSDFDVKYNFKGNEVVENISGVTLGYNESYTYTFNQKVDLSVPGNYVLKVAAQLAGDEYPGNDEKTLNIFVFDPTIYTMPSNGQSSSITTCSGTFTDAGGLEGDLVKGDEGVLTIYPSNSGDKTVLDFIEFDIGWSDFWIYDGEDETAPLIGYWEDTLSPRSIMASYQNTSGALTVRFEAQGWTPFEKPGWSANISCHTPVENDFALLKVEVAKPAVFASDYVPVRAYIKNNGTDIRSKELTFKVNGQTFATVVSDSVIQSDTMIVEATWHPLAEGDYEIEVALPDDNSADDNTLSIQQHVYPISFFYEGFEGEDFPPEGWSQSGQIWQRKTSWPAVGDAHAYSDAPYGMIDTLFTPLLNISDSAVLNFMAYSSAWWPGELDLIWVDGTTGESHFIQTINLPFIWYTNFDIDVSMAQGINYFGFVGKYNSDGGAGRVELDEVWGDGMERYFLNNDLRVMDIESDNTPVEGDTVTFTTTVKNIGSLPQSGSDYTVNLMRTPGVVLATQPGQDIDSKQSLDFSFDCVFDFAGKFDCYIQVELATDENTQNNSSDTWEVYVQQEGTEQVQVGNGTAYTTWFYPITTVSSGYFTQTLYYAEEIGGPKAITGIMYYYQNNENFPIHNIPVQLWFTETGEDDMSGALTAVSAGQKVYDGSITYLPGEHGVFIPLDFVYDYQGGNLMVTTYKPANTPYLGESKIQTTYSDTIRVRYYSGYNYTIDPYDQALLDAIPMDQQHREHEYPNIKFYKYELSGQYCIPQTVYGTINGDYVDDVEFAEISNTGTGAAGGPAYNDYLGLTANVQRGRTYELTVNTHFSGPAGSVSAWIDFNGNKVLGDEGEQVMHVKANAENQQVKVWVTIPDTAALGVSVLRIRNSTEPGLYGSCESVDYGETEDYSVNIIETEQNYNAVNDLTVAVEDNGDVSLSWAVPFNPGVAYNEGFESAAWPPQDWQLKQSASLDGTLTQPAGDTWQQNDDQDYVYNGGFSALVPETAADFQWLITPEILVYGNDELSFMLHYSVDNEVYGKFYVRVKADGSWTTILDYSDGNTPANHFDQPVTVSLSQFAGKTVQIAFVTENNNTFPVALDDVLINGVPVDGKGVAALSGYEVYKNGTLLATIDNPAETELADQVSVTENYKFCIKALYNDGGASAESCEDVFYLENMTPPVNVVANVEGNDVMVEWLAPSNAIVRFADDFESYTAGEQLACQNPEDWTTWLQEPCSQADPQVVDTKAYSGEQAVMIKDLADLMYKTDEPITSGKYSFSFRMIIPAGYNAYFNVLQEHNLLEGSHWGMQVFFDEGGLGILDGGGAGSANFNYEYDKWMYNNIVVNLDDDTAFYYINNALIHSWKWSSGINGSQTTNMLHGMDFYAWNTNNTCLYYLDDFKLTQLYNNTDNLSYNIYKDGNLLTNVSGHQYVDESVQPGYHTYCVTALYDTDESEEVCDFVDMYSAPENFVAEVENENDVLCSWDAVESSAVEGYYVYRDNQKVSGLISDTEWTDTNVEGGTHIYYVTASYNGDESLPSQNGVVVILIKPANLTAQEEGNDIALSWTGVGDVHTGQMVELYQHDGIAVNGNYQWFNIGYGVVFDLSQYPDATLEMVDFFHQSWDVYGTWMYRFHIVDWTTLTELAVVGPFQTTGDDQWELNIPLGSIASGGSQIGVFLEPMSHDPSDAYPVLAFDTELNGYSIQVSLNDYSQFEAMGGDFLLDLWIWDSFKKEMVHPQMVQLDNAGLKNTRLPYAPVKPGYELNQKVKGERLLTGYNVYHAFDAGPFSKLETVTDTTYIHTDAASEQGAHYYYVTSQYEEGESDPSDTAMVVATGTTQLTDDGFALYPNPASQMVNIRVQSPVRELILLNAVGMAVKQVKGLNTRSYTLNLEGLPAGIYYLRLNVSGKWISEKLIKQ